MVETMSHASMKIKMIQFPNKSKYLEVELSVSLKKAMELLE